MKPVAIVAVATSLLVLAACDRSDPPSDRLERAAEEVVAEVEGETLPQQAEGPYAPRDECLDQPGAAEFLSQLRSAVGSRDAEAVAALAADDIRLDFGGGSGRELLVQRLNADERELWAELSEVIAMGCASDGATLTMPWYFAQEFPGALDASTYAVVTGENVPLYSEAGAEREQVGSVSWDKVTYLGDDADGIRVSWTDSETGEQVEGYFEDASVLRSQYDYRLLASRRNNRWRITAFIAGD